MKRFLGALFLALIPLASAAADGANAAATRVTLAYQYQLPNVPGKSIKGALVEYGPGGHSEGHAHPASNWIDAGFPLTATWESQWAKYVAPKKPALRER